LISVILGVFFSIVATNYGGYIDDIFREGVEYGIFDLSHSLRDVPREEKLKIIEQARWEMEETAGLHQPFLARCLRWLGYGLTLNWGDAGRTRVGAWVLGTQENIPSLILDRLPYTLLLAGSANLLIFFPTIALALTLSRKHSSLLDKLLILISPISSIPNWIHGVLLILIFAVGLRLLPFGGVFGDQPQDTLVGYIPVVLKHMILPTAAIFLSTFFQNVYTWRSFFLLHAGEDHVELAKAKGLPPRMLERRHILRPALPNVLTSFALMLISFWQGVIILEVFFDWPGIGKFFVESILGLNRPVVVGLVVTYAYLLAITVFLLDVVYAIVDPRVSADGGNQNKREVARRRKCRFPLYPPRISRWRLFSRVNKPQGAELQVLQRDCRSQSKEQERNEIDSAGQSLLGKRWSPTILRINTRGLRLAIKEMAHYPSFVVGLTILAVLIGLSFYAVITMPYDKTIEIWRGGTDIWYRNPKKVPPEWINLFRKDKLPLSIILDSRENDGVVRKTMNRVEEEIAEITLSFPFDYSYNAFPQDLVIRFDTQYTKKKPYLSLALQTPDNRQIDMGSQSIGANQVYYLSHDRKLKRRLGGVSSIQAMFSDPSSNNLYPLQGAYELRLNGYLFEKEADLDVEFLLHGQVHGLAGTDHQRRDLLIALLWGMPVTLSFGLLGAVVTTISSMVIAALGSWFGGWVDNVIQRITEVYMILPVIPICITMYLASDKNIWVILAAVVILTIFGSGVKNYRAIFLQVKEEPYIEAAQAYGAGDGRIIIRYLVPRIIPVLIPQLIYLIPSYVFLEAMLAYLNVSDPSIPTWGKLIEAGITYGLFTGSYHMLLEPLSLLLLITLAFVMISLALERIFQSKLRIK
jgi:peptide/nickel transport system permease protein